MDKYSQCEVAAWLSLGLAIPEMRGWRASISGGGGRAETESLMDISLWLDEDRPWNEKRTIGWPQSGMSKQAPGLEQA